MPAESTSALICMGGGNKPDSPRCILARESSNPQLAGWPRRNRGSRSLCSPEDTPYNTSVISGLSAKNALQIIDYQLAHGSSGFNGSAANVGVVALRYPSLAVLRGR